ncbi:SH3 domain-containing protein, partial [Vibrio sp. 10N.222.49.C9]
LFMGNDASNVSANESYRMNREVVQTEPAKLPLLQAKVLATKLNARKEPHTKGKILYKLKRNQTVDVYMKQDGWWLVDVNGVRAWASAKYLRAQ